jgi:hypothetical protein
MLRFEGEVFLLGTAKVRLFFHVLQICGASAGGAAAIAGRRPLMLSREAARYSDFGSGCKHRPAVRTRHPQGSTHP